MLNEHKRTGDLLPPLTHLGVSAASDLMLCRGDALGRDCRGNLFSALFNMHKIMRHKIVRNGATFTCRNEDFLVSSDTDFHPTDVFEDADGSMLVIDTGGWFRIGCPTSNVAKPDVMGGIYRVRRAGVARMADPRGLKIHWTSLSAAELAKLLGDSRFEVRDHAVARLSQLVQVPCRPCLRCLREIVRSKRSARPCGPWRTSMARRPARRFAPRSTTRKPACGRRRPARPGCIATPKLRGGWPGWSRPMSRRCGARRPRPWDASARRLTCRRSWKG